MICAAGGQLSGGNAGPTGYGKLRQTMSEAVRAFFFSAAPVVRAAVLPQLTSNPCGDLASYSTAPATDIPKPSRIRVPVLAVQGGRDALFPAPAVRLQARRFTGSRSVTFETLPNAGHALPSSAATCGSRRSSQASSADTDSEPRTVTTESPSPSRS